jgi:predicted secreted acid phosphatase
MKGFALACLMAAGLSACAAPPKAHDWHDLVNVGDAGMRARAYHDSGDYDRDVAAADAQAQGWIAARAKTASKPAIVLDIDETSLSNWPAMAADDFGYFPGGTCDVLPKGPCGAVAWEMSARAAAIAPTLALVKAAQAQGVAVFFVTGRHESERAATARNLAQVGYANWSGLSLKPDAMHVMTASAYKAPVRADIEAQGYTIIANIGDQPSDLAGGHAERAFLLPNPFYRVP